MKINSISNIAFKQIYVSNALRPGADVTAAYKLCEDLPKLPSYKNLQNSHDFDVYIKSSEDYEGKNKLKVFFIGGDISGDNTENYPIIKEQFFDCPDDWEDNSTYQKSLDALNDSISSPKDLETNQDFRDIYTVYEFREVGILNGWTNANHILGKDK